MYRKRYGVCPVLLCCIVFLTSCNLTNVAVNENETATVVETFDVVSKDSTSQQYTTSEEASSKTNSKAESSSDKSDSSTKTTTDSDISKSSSNTTANSDTSESSSETTTESDTEETATDSDEEQTDIISLLYCIEDKEILYENNIDTETAPASLTKLLTASAALKHMSADYVITIGSEQELVNYGSSLCYIGVGQQLKLYDLISGMLMCSGNDAAYSTAAAVARYVYPDREMTDTESIEVFCGMMNDFAKEIGMLHSNFTTPDGWDDEGQYTTAEDLIKLTEYALSVPEIKEIVGTYQRSVVFESGENITWTNTNYLIDPYSEYFCENAVGMKTGTTERAGCCLIGAFSSNEKTYISVVLGCGTTEERYLNTLKLTELVVGS